MSRRDDPLMSSAARVGADIDAGESSRDACRRRQQTVLMMLTEHPDIRSAWLSEAAGGGIIVAVAIRGVGTAELTIDGEYDFQKAIELIDPSLQRHQQRQPIGHGSGVPRHQYLAILADHVRRWGREAAARAHGLETDELSRMGL